LCAGAQTPILRVVNVKLRYVRRSRRIVTSASSNLRLATQINGGDTLVTLTGDWITQDDEGDAAATAELFNRGDLKAIVLDGSGLGRWDSSLLVYLAAVRYSAAPRQIRVDDSGIPAAARQLLALLPPQAPAPAEPLQARPFVERLGTRLIAQWCELVHTTELVGGQLLQTGAALLGRARMRRVDFIACLYDAGIAALPMVALVNVLVGAILAFVGAIELRRFGADIYIANLVGLAQVREMAAVMTAIVMSGRTGGAYAAELASMQGSDELAALRVLGIPLQGYLVLPRVMALTLMTPILYLYGCAIGILGGFAVAVSMLHISPELFLEQTRSAVTMDQIALGLIKSIAFGALIALASCRIGLKAGRSATDVGHAATRAVVVSIIGIIMLDATFAVCANALNI
jgi:phospholipid/cholesterol/gamma-HCH transport system permease protein